MKTPSRPRRGACRAGAGVLCVRAILTKLGLAETDDDHRRVLAVLTFLEAR